MVFSFLQNTSCIRKPQVISEGGGGGGGGPPPTPPPTHTPSTFPLDPPLYTTIFLCDSHYVVTDSKECSLS